MMKSNDKNVNLHSEKTKQDVIDFEHLDIESRKIEHYTPTKFIDENRY